MKNLISILVIGQVLLTLCAAAEVSKAEADQSRVWREALTDLYSNFKVSPTSDLNDFYLGPQVQDRLNETASSVLKKLSGENLTGDRADLKRVRLVVQSRLSRVIDSFSEAYKKKYRHDSREISIDPQNRKQLEELILAIKVAQQALDLFPEGEAPSQDAIVLESYLNQLLKIANRSGIDSRIIRKKNPDQRSSSESVPHRPGRPSAPPPKTHRVHE